VLSYPAILGSLSIAGTLDARALWFYGAFASLSLVLAFGRQAYLLGENSQAVARERRLREQVVRRNEELQALTGLATTMTQTLEEGPIVERGLDALGLAARATSSALHTLEGGRLKLRAAAGDWHAEHPWASNLGDPSGELQLDRRGARVVARLPLAVRGSFIGAVTVIRWAEEPFEAEELGLLRLLCDQLAIAIQNARDYGETLEQALRDPLTGLYNRRLFLDALEREVSRTLRHGTSVALALFDIDDFKLINDTYGHAVGDEVLREIGRVVETAIRPADLFARIGGEEFGLLLPDTEQLEALLVAERVRAAVSREPIAEGLRVTVSAGVSELPSDADSREELERKADAALYWAKRNGKNLCAVAGEAMEDVPVRP
jgi:diguanylate cyclase (GGDEF)-like protein